MFSVTTLDPSEAPNSPRRLATRAIAAGFDTTVSEAHEGGKKAWSVTGAHPGGRRFKAYWSQTEAGGCKAVGAVVSDDKGERAAKSAELTAWIGAA